MTTIGHENAHAHDYEYVATRLLGSVLSPKSNAALKTYDQARDDVREQGPLAVPLHLRNAPTQLMREAGYGRHWDKLFRCRGPSKSIAYRGAVDLLMQYRPVEDTHGE